MPIDWTHQTPETIAHAKALADAERLDIERVTHAKFDANGKLQLAKDIAKLAEIIVAPLRMSLEPEQIDRAGYLATVIDELIEHPDRYTTVEIRRQCDLIDAANEDSY